MKSLGYHTNASPVSPFWPFGRLRDPLTHIEMKTKGLITVLLGALLLASCDLLKAKDEMDSVQPKEMRKDPEDKLPPGRD